MREKGKKHELTNEICESALFCLNIGVIVKETEALTVFHLHIMIVIVHRLKDI